MKKVKLTNILSKVYFTQYRQNKMLCYNGTAQDAKQYLKSCLGIKRTITSFEYTIDVYLPCGYASIEII